MLTPQIQFPGDLKFVLDYLKRKHDAAQRDQTLSLTEAFSFKMLRYYLALPKERVEGLANTIHWLALDDLEDHFYELQEKVPLRLFNTYAPPIYDNFSGNHKLTEEESKKFDFYLRQERRYLGDWLDEIEELQYGPEYSFFRVIQKRNECILTGTNGAIRPLQYAAKNGHLEVVKYLHTAFKLEKKDAQKDYNYALRSAAENGHLDVVEYLKKEMRVE